MISYWFTSPVFSLRWPLRHCVPCHGALGARTKAFALILMVAALVLAAFAGIAFVFRHLRIQSWFW